MVVPSFSVGVFKNGRVEIIANDQGNRITPSYVAFTAEGERLIGDAAKNQLTTNPENTVSGGNSPSNLSHSTFCRYFNQDNFPLPRNVVLTLLS